MQPTYTRDLFLASTPHRPYCTDVLGDALRVRSRSQATAHRYIQHNPPCSTAFLVFDFDGSGAMVAHEDAGLPLPTWCTENPVTRRGHLAYALACPIITTDAARAKPMRYAASVEQGYRDALRADSGYANFLTKTPDHPDWRTRWGRPEPYTLEELADWLPHGLPKVKPKREHASGLGRNVTLFEGLRQWAYRARLRFDDCDQWHMACRCHADAINGEFVNPLPPNEVTATAKSVAKWVWQRFDMARFSAIQSVRGKAGGKASVISRKSKQMDRLQRVLEFNQ